VSTGHTGGSPWFTVGLIVGAAVGAAVVLLYVPSSGKETIEAIKRHFRNARDEARRAGIEAEADVLGKYKHIRNVSLASQPGPESLAPKVP
jgi:gas vesicle protein